MRVLIFHGYLLRGTGSNVYNANLAQALARAGHDVQLLCQDLEAGSLPWIDGVGRWRDGALAVEETGVKGRESNGSVTAYLPDIAGLLPVYVADTYVGFEAKAFPDLSEAELDRYIAANVAAVGDVVARAGGVDAALSNHLVMGPVILARAGLSFAAKVHGSALSYTVIPNPRFLPHAREGMAAARTVLVGSRHTAESLWETITDDALPAKTRLGPPGVDIDAFAPLLGDEDPAAELEALATTFDCGAGADGPSAGLGRDLALAARGVRAYAGADGPRVIFVGKLIVSKGCDLLLAAWPLVVRENPGARLLLIGFGEYHGALERLWASLTSGDIADARQIAAQGRLLEGGAELPLRYLDAFLADLPDGYAEAAAESADSLSLAGRLEYGEVAGVVRCSDAMVVPSTFPEAFGMVAAEAAAAGALPVCANHSGLAEVAGTLGAAMPGELGRLTSFDLGPRTVGDIAARLNSWLSLLEPERAEARAALVETVRARWSWDGVATSVIAASTGHLDELADVPSG